MNSAAFTMANRVPEDPRDQYVSISTPKERSQAQILLTPNLRHMLESYEAEYTALEEWRQNALKESGHLPGAREKIDAKFSRTDELMKKTCEKFHVTIEEIRQWKADRANPKVVGLPVRKNPVRSGFRFRPIAGGQNARSRRFAYPPAPVVPQDLDRMPADFDRSGALRELADLARTLEAWR